MKIVLNPGNKKSVRGVVKKLNAYKEDFLAKEQEFTRRLAEIGVTVARTGYATGADYYDASDIVVRLEKTAKGYAVIAEGETVGFVEFGTGIKNREWVDDNNVSGDPYKPPKHGTYGEGHGAQPWGWWYRPRDGRPSVHTYGEVPVEAMLLSRDEIVANVIRIAREVWL